MTREESWEVEGVTLTILRHIASLGYTVSVFRIPSSPLGTRPGSVEMQALDQTEISVMETQEFCEPRAGTSKGRSTDS